MGNRNSVPLFVHPYSAGNGHCTACSFCAHHSTRNFPHFYPLAIAKSALVWSLALGAWELEDDLLLVGIELFVCGLAGAEKRVAEISEDGGAAERYSLFVVGHNADEKTRSEMAGWLKEKYPNVKILALNLRDQELPSADYNVSGDGPEKWLAIVAQQLGEGTGA